MLPDAESPIPDSVGVGTIFAAAGAVSMLMTIVSTMLGQSEERRNELSMRGMQIGAILGLGLYILALVGEVL